MSDHGSSSSNIHRAKCCDICGDMGSRQALFTCSRCKDSHQHIYCMRTLRAERPINWLCEDCDPGKDKALKELVGSTSQRPHQGSGHSEVFPSLRRLNYISGFKNANFGKTKPLSEHDAVNLANGATNPRVVESHTIKPDRLRGNDSKGHKHATMNDQRLNSRSIIKTPLKKHMLKEQPKGARQDANGTRLVLGKSPLGISFAMHKDKCPASISSALDKGKSPASFSSALDKGKSPLGVPFAAQMHGQRPFRSGSVVSHGVRLQQVPVPVKSTFNPSAAAIWTGSFRVYNASQQLEDILIFRAYPPSRVYKKIYEFSKSMPDRLQFQLTPRYNIWADIDQHLCWDNRDIGLYFFPVNKKRWEKYDRLQELMQTKDYAMRARVDGMELLIFTSRVLSSNFQMWEGRHFLWGLFRKVGKPPAPILHARPPHALPPPPPPRPVLKRKEDYPLGFESMRRRL